jgi:hypothetical protein
MEMGMSQMTRKSLSGRPSVSFGSSGRRRPHQKFYRPEILALEDRILPSTVSWNVDVSGAWENAANWIDDQGVHRLPGPSDIVVIGRSVAVAVALGSTQAVQGLTTAGNVTLLLNDAANLTLTGAVSNDGTIELDPSATTANLQFSGNVTAGGAGQWWLNPTGQGQARVSLTGGSTVILQAGQTVHGRGEFGSNGQGTIVNHGVINADVSGAMLALDGALVTNSGTLEATNGGTLSLGPSTSFSIDDPGTLVISPTATVTLGGSLAGQTQNGTGFNPLGTLLLNGPGTAAAPQLLEGMSQDLGDVAAGFQNNFAYGTLALGNHTYVQLVDNAKNSPAGSGPEALYVNALILPADCTLDLHGAHLYARVLQVAGTVVGGSVATLPAGGPLILNTPAAGNLSSATQVDSWTLSGHAGQMVTVLVDTGTQGSLPAVPPALNYAQVQLLDPNGSVLASGTSTQSGADVLLQGVILPADGSYTVQVGVPASQATGAGHYVLSVWDASVNSYALNLGQTMTGHLATRYAQDRWSFSGVPNEQVQFNVQSAASAVQFDLTGPGGFTAFSQQHGSSGLITLPASGTYVVTAHQSDLQTGAYAFQLNQTSQTALTLGSPYQGTFAGSGQAQLFTVTLANRAGLSVVLSDANSQDQNEVYVSLGTAPTRDTYQYRSSATGANQTVLLPGQPGTYFILVYSRVSSPGSAYSILVQDHALPGVKITGLPLFGIAGTTMPLGSLVFDLDPAANAAGFLYAWTVTYNGSSFANGTAPNFNFMPMNPGSYVLTLTVTDVYGITALDRESITILNGPSVSTSPAGPVLLPISELNNLILEAAAYTPQWQAFKSRLDQNLNVVITGGYQGSNLSWIRDYALGYQVLKYNDPVTAAQYADKAIAVLKSGLNDYQEGDWTSRQFLAVGDGSTTTFALANSDVVPSSVHVYLSPITTQAVVHGQTNGQDAVDYNQTFLRVNKTPVGRTAYTQGVDWTHNPKYDNNMIDWSLGSARQPAPGATYYVTESSAAEGTRVAFTLTGNQITLATAPAADQAVFVEYVYGTHSADGSTLAYQQTSGGGGGLNNIWVDSGYTARFLGNVALGLNWLDGYVGFSAALKAQTVATLSAWSNQLPLTGYHYANPESNYGAGEYAFKVLTALALQNQVSNGPQLVASAVAYRNKFLLPLIQTGDMNGGYYPDGWNYGALAVSNILLGSTALADAGLIDETPERQWASQVITALVSEQPSPDTIFDGGDWYTYPSPFPGVANDLMAILSNLATDPAAQSYANYILQNYPGQGTHDSFDLLFHDPSAPASYWSSLPLSTLEPGMGLLTARSDWGPTPTWVAVEMGNLANDDHQTETPGQVQIQRGADDLLINAAALGNLQGLVKSKYGNLVVVDSNGDRSVQTYPYHMGAFYGNYAGVGVAGVTINAYEATANYTYLYGNYAAAYSTYTNPGGGGPVSELTRQVVYLNPNNVVVFDRVTTLKPEYVKEQQWNFLNPPEVSGNSFVETVGSSRLFGQTFSTTPLTTTLTPVVVNGATVQELDTQPAVPTASVRYVTAFRVASASNSPRITTQQIVSTDGRMQGVAMGNQVVLFGSDGDVDLTTPVSYQTLKSGLVQQLLTNLSPGKHYQVTVNGSPGTTVTASSQGTISFTTTGSGTDTIQVQLVGP